MRIWIVSAAIAGALGGAGVMGGLLLAGSPATAAPGMGSQGSVFATTVVATSPSATPKAHHNCPHDRSHSSASTTNSTSNA